MGNKVIKLHFSSMYEREEKFELNESNENYAFVINSVCVNNQLYFIHAKKTAIKSLITG